MRARLFSCILFACLSSVTISCSDKDDQDEVVAPQPDPLKDITGRWDTKSVNSKVYNERGVMEYETTLTGGSDDYYLFNADKTFTYYNKGNLAIVGTYTHTNTTLTLSTSQFTATRNITTFTATNLVFNTGGPEPGTRTVVQVETLVKH